MFTMYTQVNNEDYIQYNLHYIEYSLKHKKTQKISGEKGGEAVILISEYKKSE